jgi:PAS domain S-box-containing protein
MDMQYGELPVGVGVSETWLRQILDNSTALVYVKDRDGRYLFANHRLLELFGLREAEVIGRLDGDIFPGRSPPVFATMTRRYSSRTHPSRSRRPPGCRRVNGSTSR